MRSVIAFLAGNDVELLPAPAVLRGQRAGSAVAVVQGVRRQIGGAGVS